MEPGPAQRIGRLPCDVRGSSTSACAIRGPYSGRVVGAAFVAGAVTHAILFLGYGLFKAEVIGNLVKGGGSAVIRQDARRGLWKRGAFVDSRPNDP
jgi:hypothetical protein